MPLLNIARAADFTVNPAIPGTYSSNSVTGIVANVYQFALMLGGLLAFAMIVYAGVKYAASAGNPNGQHDARDQITQALLGLLLLMGIYLILNVLNPNLTSLSLPELNKIEKATAPVPGGDSVSTCSDANPNGGCPVGKSCMADTSRPGHVACVANTYATSGLGCNPISNPSSIYCLPAGRSCQSMSSVCKPGTCASYTQCRPH